MAKLTARFDMEDKITKKLKIMQGRLEGLEKSRDSLNKPIVLEAKDKATKKINKVNDTVEKFIKPKEVVIKTVDKATKPLEKINEAAEKVMKSREITIQAIDEITKPIKKINKYIERKMPKTHTIIMEAQDKTKTTLEKIRRYMGRNILGVHMMSITARDKATPAMHKIANYGKRALSKGYSFSVRAIDIATKTVGRIASYARTALPKYRDFTIRAIDSASRIIGGIKRAVFSIPSVITVALAVVGAGKLSESTIGAAMNFEGYEVAMNHWLDGNKKKASELIGWMGKFADKTPFNSADLFPALSRGVGLSGGDIKQAKSLLKISTDMAALTPGKTVSDAMEALGDAKMGEFERMKEFNLKMTKDKFGNIGGWSGFVKVANSKFEGGAEALSSTVKGKLSTIKGYIGTNFREIGNGILESMDPRLEKITKWLDNNQEKWKEWKETVRKSGEQAAEWIFSKFEKGFSYIRDNYLENDEFKKLDFEGKVEFIMSDLGDWWNKKGLPWVSEVGMTLGKSITEGIIWGAKEGFKGIGNLWTDALKNPSVGSIATAGIATAIGMSIISLLVSPLVKAFRIGGSIIKGALSAGKWVGGLFGAGKGKGKGPKIPPVVPTTSGKQPKIPKGKPSSRVYTQPWFDKGKKVPTPNDGKGFKLPKGISKLAKFGKRIPYVGTAISALTLAAAPKEEMPGAIGAVGGGLAGTAIGTAIFPGVGTVIGGILGSIGGSKLGQKIGDSIDLEPIAEKFSSLKKTIGNTVFNGEWWSGKWNDVLSWSSGKWGDVTSAWSTFKESIGTTIFNSEWWSEKWNDAVAWGSEKWGSIKDTWSAFKETIGTTIFNAEWWAGKWGFAVGWTEGKWEGIAESWSNFKTTIGDTIFNADWWSEKWNGAVAWAGEKFGPIVETWNTFKTSVGSTIFNSDWWAGKWNSAVAWGSDKWGPMVETWDNFKESVGNTVFNGEWWHNKWDGVVSWGSSKWGSMVETWEKFKDAVGETIFNNEWWSDKWQDTAEWGRSAWEGATDVWDGFKTKISDSLFNKSWWKGKWNNAIDWGKGKWSKVKEWFDGATSAYNEGKEKGRSAAKHADGGLINRPHLGLVGEAGPEMIIPLSSGRRGRAMDLYGQTGQMLGVQPYANGGQVGKSIKSPSIQGAVVQASVNINQVSAKEIEKEASLYGEKFSKSVAKGINGNVVSLDNWKNRNIQQPMQNVVNEAVGFGAGTVNAFASGQNATSTRTRPYLVSNIHNPFNETKGKGSVWGSGTISEFVSGMRSQGAQVKEASKYLAEQVEKTFKEELGIHSPSRVMAKLGQFASIGIVKGLGSVNVKKFAESQAGSLAAAFSGMGAVGGNVQSWLQAAMMMTGVPSSWLGALGVIAKKESGGNPKAQNNWDINAKNGIPSKGLMQTIGPTFNAYKGKGMNDIFNPIHNAVAAINYIKSRYGSIFNVPGIKSMANGGAYKGYYKGTNGPLSRSETAWVGERGPELVNLPRGSEVFSNQESMDMASGLPEEQMTGFTSSSSGSQSRSVGRKVRDVIIQITGDNHFTNDTDIETFANKIVTVIEKKLEDEYFEGGEMVVYD